MKARLRKSCLFFVLYCHLSSYPFVLNEQCLCAVRDMLMNCKSNAFVGL